MSRTGSQAVLAPNIHPGSSRDLQSPQTKRTSTLPGFQNAFNDATPLRPTRKPPSKGNFSFESSPSHEPRTERHALDPFSQITYDYLHNDSDIMTNGNEDAHLQLTSVLNADGGLEMQQMSSEQGKIDEVGANVEEGYLAETPDRKREVKPPRYCLLVYL